MKKNELFMNLTLFDTAIISRTDADALIPVEESQEIIQGAIAQSAVLSQGRRLSNMSSKKTKMKVLEMLPTAYFVDGDTGMKQTTSMKWKDKFIVAAELAAIVPIPEAVLDDADYDIWGEVKPRLMEAFGAKIDGAILYNTNKPSEWRNGILQTATAAGNVVSLASATDLYEAVMGEGGTIAKVEEDGFFVNGHIASIGMRAKLRGLRDQDGRPLYQPNMTDKTRYSLDGENMVFPRNGAFDPAQSLMISGDFSELVYSIRQDMTFKIFDSGVIQDPSSGEIIYNLMQQDMVALRAVMRLGWEIPNPINLLEPTESARCPFAVLTN